MAMEELAQYDGVYAVTVTPFTATLDLDLDSLEPHLESLLEAGIPIMTINGNTGEFFTMTLDESLEVLERAKAVVGDRAKMVAGVGYDVATAVDLASRGATLGYDAVMVHGPLSPYVSTEGFESYITEIAKACPISVIPYVRSSLVTVESLANLARLENTVAVKYSVNDLDRVSQLTDLEGVVWCCGTAEAWAPSFFEAGATTFTSGLANVAPKLALRLFAALRSGDAALTAELSEQARDFEGMRAANSSGPNVSVVKEALSQLGRLGPSVRPPSALLGQREKDQIAGILERWEKAELI